MAYSDFDFLTANRYAYQPVANGYAHTNASLSNPLSNSGTYCRKLRHTSTYYGAASTSEIAHFLKSTVSSGGFVNPSQSHAISLRASVRLAGVEISGATPTLYHFLGLTAFAAISNGGNNAFDGYSLGLYQDKNNSVTLRMRLAAAGGLVSDYLTLQCSGTYTINTWYSIRLDLIPLSGNQKRIDAYTSSDLGNSWDLVGSYTLSSTDSVWRTSGKCGVISSFYSAVYGGSTISATDYIDDFKAYLITNPS